MERQNAYKKGKGQWQTWGQLLMLLSSLLHRDAMLFPLEVSNYLINCLVIDLSLCICPSISLLCKGNGLVWLDICMWMSPLGSHFFKCKPSILLLKANSRAEHEASLWVYYVSKLHALHILCKITHLLRLLFS